MRDQDKTKEQLIDEIVNLRQQLSAFRSSFRELEAAGDEQHVKHGRFENNVQEQVRESSPRYEYSKKDSGFIDTVFNNIGSLIIVLDREGRIVCFNLACQAATGYSFQEVAGKRITEILTDDAASTRARLEDNLRGHNPSAHESAWITKSGERRLIAWSNTAIFDNNGEVDYIIATGSDISERKQVENALYESEEKLRMILDYSPHCIVLTDLSGVIIDCSQTSLDVTGFTKEEMMGMNAYELIVPRDRAMAAKNMKEIVAQDTIRAYEFTHVNKEGREYEFELTADLIKDRNGRPVAVITVLKDITERKQAERELALRALLLDSANDSIILLDFEGKFHYVNEVACKFYGYTREEMMQKNVLELHTPEPAGVKQFRDNELKTKGYCVFEVFNIRKDGTSIPIEVNTRVIDIEGKQFMLSVSRDITERKQVEERLKYLSFHDSFTGIYNRSFFDEELRRVDVARQLPLSIIMGDANGLKLVNDTFGHQAGDSLLATAAAILQRSCRSEDIICRWGGDEFAILLPQTDRKTAEEICDRIRMACEKASAGPAPLSFALGTATKEDGEQNMELVLKEAEDIMYRDKLLDSRSTRFSMITYFQRSLAERSAETLEHGKRIQDIVARMGDKLGLSRRKKEELDILATLHDIGQIAIPGDLLVKPCYLTESEWGLIRKHPEIGEKIALSVPDLNNISEAILSHYEYWNGMGYPRGLKGEQIPLLSRILSIADAYDVMTNGRPYKKAINHRGAVKKIEKCAGTQFDPELVELFVETVLIKS